MLGDVDDVETIGEAATGVQAVELAEELVPDVILMDLRMPDLDGIEATRRLSHGSLGHGPAILVLTMFEDDDSVFAAMRAGACGYLLKSATTQEIVSGIAAAARGDALLSPSVAAQLLERAREQPVRTTVPDPAAASLTDREIEVLRLLSSGMDNAEIGRTLSALAGADDVKLPRELVLIGKQFLYVERYMKLLAPTWQMMSDSQLTGYFANFMVEVSREHSEEVEA